MKRLDKDEKHITETKLESDHTDHSSESEDEEASQANLQILLLSIVKNELRHDTDEQPVTRERIFNESIPGLLDGTIEFLVKSKMTNAVNTLKIRSTMKLDTWGREQDFCRKNFLRIAETHDFNAEQYEHLVTLTFFEMYIAATNLAKKWIRQK